MFEVLCCILLVLLLLVLAVVSEAPQLSVYFVSFCLVSCVRAVFLEEKERDSQ